MKKLRLLFILSLTMLAFAGCSNQTTSSDIIEEENISDIDNAPVIDDELTEESNGEDTDMDSGITDVEILDDDHDNDTDSDNETSNDNETEIDSSDEDNTDNTETDLEADNEPFVSPNHDAIQELINQKYELLESDDSYEKTHDVYEINKQIAELNCYDFSDTKITFIGDSITFGQGGDWNQYNNFISYVDYVRDILGCQTKNMGIPGSMIGSYNGYDGMVYKVDLIPNDTDIIVLFGGINDFMNGDDTFGDDSCEEGTFTGDAKKLFYGIKERFPDTPVYVVTIYKNKIEAATHNQIPFTDYVQVLRILANQCNFEIIDLYKYDLMDNTVFNNFAAYFDDMIHPNNNGYMWLGRYVAAEIIEDYN